jgi:hemerythrin-like domain-containing protein
MSNEPSSAGARHRSLVPLSHDHHHGLVAAVRMKRGEAPYRDAMDLADGVARLWRDELRAHFEQEEECLFTQAYSAEVRSMIDRALGEHVAISALADQFARGEGSIDHARELGALLEGHIRFEERELFPAIQREASEEMMGEIGEAIAGRRGGKP